MSKNAAFSDFIEDNNLLSNKRSISSGIPVQSEVSSISKHPLNLNINSSKTVDGKSKTAKDISENVIVCKKPAVITCTDSVNSQVLQEVENAEIQLQNDEINSIILNLCESVSEKLNVNEIVAINTDENRSKNKSIETCQEVTKKSNKEISAARTNFSARMTVSEDNNNLKGNKSLSRNIDQLLEYASAKPFKKAGASTSSENGFDSTLSKLLEFCGQTRIIPFDELYNWSHTTVRKIGEGTYGEVFTLVQNKISSVIKVIPFSEESGGNDMQSIESVLSEVTVSNVHLVRGYYPDQMLVAWNKFSNAKITYNSRPVFTFDEIHLEIHSGPSPLKPSSGSLKVQY
ncbi:unnamed protein product [Larinioides sclopetarius]|uniref:Protein kinase domain-containing protein n=1 Tax=Larinioides sclopetarius TaxID=280406 RepID=A0AAV2BRX1_9ARAC